MTVAVKPFQQKIDTVKGRARPAPTTRKIEAVDDFRPIGDIVNDLMARLVVKK